MDGKKRGKVSFVPLTKDTVHLLQELKDKQDDFLFLDRKIEVKRGKQVDFEKQFANRVVIQLYEGKPCGYFELKHHPARKGTGINEISWAYVKDEFKGKGLSKKMNKEALRISEMEGIPIFANPIQGARAKNAAKNLGVIIKAKADKAKKQSAVDKAKKTRH